MSIAQRSLMDLLALERECQTCGAGRGVWCRIREGFKTAGEPAQFLHVDRERPIRHARWVGYTEGHLDALRGLQHRLKSETLEDALAHMLQIAERWANSAHQAALEDIPEGWHR